MAELYDAAASAMGSILSPLEADEGYDSNYSAAVNICSAPTGILIPPSAPLILFSITAGGVSGAALFMGGYFVGAILSLCMAIAAIILTGDLRAAVLCFVSCTPQPSLNIS